MDKNFKPLINNKNSSTLQEKKVSIQGNSDFSRFDVNTDVSILSNINELNSKSNTEDKRLKATMTQKISPLVNLKINTLKPFLGDLEDMPKATVNEIVDILIDSYVGVRLTTRQQEAFKSMLDMQFELIKK